MKAFKLEIDTNLIFIKVSPFKPHHQNNTNTYTDKEADKGLVR